jgi:thiamine-monophosphate kinase
MDDTALLDGLVITHDTIAEGIHFLTDDPADSVGWKLAAVNASDLAAKGAAPAGALMSFAMSGDAAWDAAFLDGVEEALTAFGMPLIGGDTIALPPGLPRVLGMTAIGRAGPVTPSRAGGKPGDALVLVGTLGDAAAGLALLRQDRAASGPLVEAYRRPKPLLAEGRALAGVADAMMDVSDGLLLDAARMGEASGCGIAIDLDAVPLSDAFVMAYGDSLDARLFAATGGDDYALLAAVPARDEALGLHLPSGATIHIIGKLTDGEGLSLTYQGQPLPVPERLGYEHRLA